MQIRGRCACGRGGRSCPCCIHASKQPHTCAVGVKAAHVLVQLLCWLSVFTSPCPCRHALCMPPPPQEKFAQINEFLKLLSHTNALAALRQQRDGPLHILDCGCGSSHLTLGACVWGGGGAAVLRRSNDLPAGHTARAVSQRPKTDPTAACTCAYICMGYGCRGMIACLAPPNLSRVMSLPRLLLWPSWHGR